MAVSTQFSDAVRWLWNQGQPFPLFANDDRLKPLRSQSSPLREFQRYLLELSDQDADGYDLSVPNALSTGWRILDLFLKCLVGRYEVRLEAAAAELQKAWAPTNPPLARLLNAALDLCL